MIAVAGRILVGVWRRARVVGNAGGRIAGTGGVRIRRPRAVLIGAAVAAVLIGAPTDGAGQIKGSEKATVTQVVDGTEIEIAYARPSLRGRSEADLFGDQIAWGRSWTPGANWATTFEVNRGVQLAGTEVPAGKYSVWMVPEKEGPWTFVLDPRDSLFHTVHPEETEEQIRFDVEVTEASYSMETLTWYLPEVRRDGADLRLQWGTMQVTVDLEVEPTQKTTVTAEEAAPYIGWWSVRIPPEMYSRQATEDFVFEVELEMKDDRLFGEMQFGPDNSGVAFLVPRAEGVFATGYSVAGELVEVDLGTLWEFELDEDGRATAFEIRFGNDRVWMSGERR